MINHALAISEIERGIEMEIKTIAQNMSKVLSGGMNDVVHGDLLVKDTPAVSVLVSAQTDLANLPAYPAGTIAYTAGFKAMWQLDASGSWISVM